MSEFLISITPIDWLLDPLTHDFMRRALMVSALVGGVCGLLSCYMTLKGWALMGDAVSHAVMPGVVVAYALGLPFSLGAFVFGVGSGTHDFIIHAVWCGIEGRTAWIIDRVISPTAILRRTHPIPSELGS